MGIFEQARRNLDWEFDTKYYTPSSIPALRYPRNSSTRRGKKAMHDALGGGGSSAAH